jgi:NADH-quinone oxidoreductase subunit K
MNLIYKKLSKNMNWTDLLLVSMMLFFIGLVGIVLVRRNLILVLISIEIMLLSVNFNLAVFSYVLDDVVGQVFFLFVLAIAAAESSIGLAILVTYHRLNGLLLVDLVRNIKG